MQNDMRDRLVELLINADVYDSYACKLCTKEDYCDYCNAEKLADNLIANDVVPVVKCSQCQKRYTTECALWFSQLDDKQYFCGAIHNDDFYCSYGERE